MKSDKFQKSIIKIFKMAKRKKRSHSSINSDRQADGDVKVTAKTSPSLENTKRSRPCTRYFARKTFNEPMPELVVDIPQALRQLNTEFISRYGPGPNFKELPLNEVIQQAFSGGAEERKPLAIYIHQEGSIQTNVFCSQVLCQESITSYINHNFISWAWDISHLNNRKRFMELCKNLFGSAVVACLNNLQADNFPVLMLVQGKGRTHDVTAVLQGNLDVNELMANLVRVQEQVEKDRRQDIIDENARKDREKIIQEQEIAYQRSLEVDRRKRIEKEEAERRDQLKKKIKDDAEQMKIAEIDRLKHSLPPEPSNDCSQSICQIRFRAPNGQTFTRNFLSSDTLQRMVDFAGSQGYLSSTHNIFRSFPKTNISLLNLQMSLSDCGISKREAVAIEATFDEEEEDE